MTIKRKSLAIAIATSLGMGIVATSAQGAALTSMVITGGTFAMGVFTPVANTITNFGGQDLISGTYPAGWNTAVAQTGPASGAIMAWDFNGGGTWVNVFSEATSSGDETGGAMTGTINITDNWNGNNFFQGGSFTGTGDGTNFDISWTSTIVGGPFDGQTGTYNVTGTYTTGVAPIPVPAAAWLMGSGLVGLVGVARRRTKAKA